MTENLMKAKNRSKLIALVLIVVIAVIALYRGGVSPVSGQDNLGLSILLSYTDGTSRIINSPGFTYMPQLSGVFDGTKQVTTIQVSVLLLCKQAATASMFQGLLDVKFDDVSKGTIEIMQTINVPAQTVVAVPGTTVTAVTILSWASVNTSRSHNLAFNMLSGSILHSTPALAFNGQTADVSLVVDTTGVEVPTPPYIPPPTPSSVTVGLTVDYSSIQVGGAATFTASAAGGQSPYTYEWFEAMGTGTYALVSGQTSATLQRVYTLPSIYYVYVKAKDYAQISGQSTAVAVTVTATPPPPQRLFEDGFETGDFSLWSSTWVGTAEAEMAVVTTTSHGGTYSARFSATSVSSGTGARANYNIVAGSDVYARMYFCLTQGVPFTADNQYIQILGFEQNSPNYMIGCVRIQRIAGVDIWRVATSDGTTWTYANGGTFTQINQWVCVELHVNVAASGTVEMWLNGNLAASLTGVNTSSFVIDRVRMGLCWKVSGVTTAPMLYIDDCVIDNERIGG